MGQHFLKKGDLFFEVNDNYENESENSVEIKVVDRESIKKYYFVLELCYSATLKVELHCSTIAIFYAIVEFYNSE